MVMTYFCGVFQMTMTLPENTASIKPRKTKLNFAGVDKNGDALSIMKLLDHGCK